MFKKGIEPKYEDKCNIDGGEFGCRKGFKGPDLDSIWESLLYGLVGETFEDGNEITGVRLADKSKNGRAMFRVEVWYRDDTKAAFKDKLLSNLVSNVRGIQQADWSSRNHKY